MSELWRFVAAVGLGRTRTLRDDGGAVVSRPRRSRCGECGGSHVLLPVFALLRRADAVSVIGAALAARAGGAGVRKVAAVVGRPVETVRGWLRCFTDRAEAVRVAFTALLVGVGVDPVPPAATSSVFADAVAAIVGASMAARSRWPEIGELPAWLLAAAVTGADCRPRTGPDQQDQQATRVASPGADLDLTACPDLPFKIRRRCRRLMSKANEEQQTRLERARQIGLFRYMLIREAADATLTGRQRGALVRALAAQAHTEPDGRIVRITRWTLDRWIQNYREGGFDALVPSPRQSQPRTPPEVFELAAALKKENPSRSAAQVRRILPPSSVGRPTRRPCSGCSCGPG